MKSAGRILVVDDDRDILKMMAFVFESNGFEVRTCDNATEALVWALADHSDYVVTDYDMPGIDGLELIHRLRNRLPAAIIIGMSGKDRGMEFLLAGANDFLLKPFTPYDLIMMIEGRTMPN